jgi:predicted porin
MRGKQQGSHRHWHIAAASALIGAWLNSTPVQAADLGGDCCADLEQRVAELEATTARKGNAKVSVQLYGKVNRMVEFWDDGAEKSTYVTNNSYSPTRFGIKGTAKIGGDWSSGYRLEIEDSAALSKELNQINDDGRLRELNVRHSFLFLKNEKLGELRMGLTWSPKDDITKDTHVLGEIVDTVHSDFYPNKDMFLRPKGFNTESGLSSLTYGAINRCYSSGSALFDCSTRRNMVVYVSPTFAGFWVNLGWGENDIWSTSLRYKGDFDKWKIGGGVAVEDFRDENVENSGGGLNGFKRDLWEWGGSASVLHKPTGLFLFGAFTTSDDHDTDRNDAGIFTGTSSPDMVGWDIEGGIQRPWTELGKTTLLGGYTEGKDGIGGAGGPTRLIKAGVIPSVPVNTEITGSRTTKWYLAADQELAKASMDLYVVFQHIDPEIDLVDSALNPVGAPLDNFDVLYTGARIYF